MKWIKRIAIALVSIVLLIVLIDIGVNWWISARLPHIINEQNDSPYQITYKNLKISLLDRSLKATEIVVVPKSSLDTKKAKSGLYAKIKSLEVNGFSILQIVFSSKIKADNLVVNNPEVTLLKQNDMAIDHSKSIGSEVVKPFSKIILVDNVFLNHGSVKITGVTNNRRILDIANVNIKLEGIAITDQTLTGKLPFTFKTYSVDCDSVYYRNGEFYHVETRKIQTTQAGLSIKNFKLVPEYGREKFIRKITSETDIYTISAGDISVKSMAWGFHDEKFFFNSKSIMLDDVDVDIYRNKGPIDNPKKKKLYSDLLRNIPFPMKVDALVMHNSKLKYEEATDFDKPPGILTFSKFNMRITNLQSGFRQKKMPDVRIKVLCNFMETSKLDVDWTFNVLDKTDAFNIRGRFFDFPAEKLSAFTKPYMNATVKGSLDEVYFNFNGNDDGSKGDFGINYDNLKVNIYKKKDPEKKNKIVSAIANLFVKHDTKDKVKMAEISVKRLKDRSFFNLLWKSLEEGLKKILL